MNERRNIILSLFLLACALACGSAAALAQTPTTFTYQGRLADGGTHANGTYDLEFKLYDAANVQIGATSTREDVPVVNGIFTVQLDFGSAFDGNLRFLEIGVRPGASVDPFTTLSPQQQVTATPYAIRSLTAAVADTATNAAQLDGLSSTEFIRNSTSQQAGADFNISGHGTIGGDLTVNGSLSLSIVDAQTQFNLAGNRILGVAGTNNLFAGFGAGLSISTGFDNAFFGHGAGEQNTTGRLNAFFGIRAGYANTIGRTNAFFGWNSGASNIDGSFNAFFGTFAGNFNTSGFDNSIFGDGAGSANTTGSGNSIFGADAGRGCDLGFKVPCVMPTTGSDNSFFGRNAGRKNTVSNNAFFGANAGKENTTGGANTFVGHSAGTLNSTGVENSFLGKDAGFSNTTGGANIFIGYAAGFANQTGFFNTIIGRAAGLNNTASFNAFFGAGAGEANVTGTDNSFFGTSVGAANLTGSSNSFFGRNAGRNNLASDNSFFGSSAGFSNTTGDRNAFFGITAGLSNTTGCCNSFFGNKAGLNNTEGRGNSFVGGSAGRTNTVGDRNSFFGDQSGWQLSTGSDNTFIGSLAGASLNTGTDNTIVGSAASASNNLTNATAIGANAFVSSSNSLVLGGINGVNGAIADTNVGIGTSTPAFKLTVQTATGNYGFVQTDGAITLGSYVGASASGATGGWLGTLTPQQLHFFTGGGQPAMTVDTTGNVGVGTANPSERLQVVGNVTVTGNLSKGGGSFRIDHPLDPENKTLSHSFVESPDMMNIYNGVVVLNRRGEAIITLPDYFEALNRDFRYQLTCIGRFAPVFIAQEVKGNQFKIAGGWAGMKISWQVTGIRQDAYANAHRIPIEENKSASERGSYLHPDSHAQQKATLSSGKSRARRAQTKTER